MNILSDLHEVHCMPWPCPSFHQIYLAASDIICILQVCIALALSISNADVQAYSTLLPTHLYQLLARCLLFVSELQEALRQVYQCNS